MISSRYEDVPVYSVNEIAQQVKLELESRFALIAIVGEISNYTLHSSGHAYFTVKDEGAQISAVLFKYQRLSSQCQLRDGMKIKAYGKISLYSKTGRYQIVLKHVESLGQGELEKRLKELMVRLKKEGLFDQPKKSLPQFPSSVGIVTSPTGAAIQDILRVSRRRYPLAEIRLYPARVQGERSHEEVIEGIRYFKKNPVDVLIIGRGGGSLEDLWAFNEESLAYEVFNYPFPIVSAVGHEIDHSVTDFVADVRAATPSAAAEIVFPDQGEYVRYLSQNSERLTSLISSKMNQYHIKLESIGQLSYFTNRVQDKIDEYTQDIDHLSERFQFSMKEYLSRRFFQIGELQREIMQRNVSTLIQKSLNQVTSLYHFLNKRIDKVFSHQSERLTSLSGKLSVLGPMETLSRGYAMIQDDKSKVIQSIHDIHCNQQLKVRVKDGFFEAKVIDKEETT